MKINHIVDSTPAVVPIKDVASESMRATDSSPVATTASDTTRHTGDSPSLSVQQVLRQVNSGDFDAVCVEQIRNAIQNGTLKMDVDKTADAVLSNVQSLFSTRFRKA